MVRRKATRLGYDQSQFDDMYEQTRENITSTMPMASQKAQQYAIYLSMWITLLDPPEDLNYSNPLYADFLNAIHEIEHLKQRIKDKEELVGVKDEIIASLKDGSRISDVAMRITERSIDQQAGILAQREASDALERIEELEEEAEEKDEQIEKLTDGMQQKESEMQAMAAKVEHLRDVAARATKETIRVKRRSASKYARKKEVVKALEVDIRDKDQTIIDLSQENAITKARADSLARQLERLRDKAEYEKGPLAGSISQATFPINSCTNCGQRGHLITDCKESCLKCGSHSHLVRAGCKGEYHGRKHKIQDDGEDVLIRSVRTRANGVRKVRYGK
ncbi:uncharacterized protein LY89DRAFT_665835 [Mollisia scopiformis]|uniref:CCHC-type domain-containing protein n=1 Tax=Mollisia scopiformis TaxID=149040 RepID=A0A194XML6_MOLSC|nr:uncharacterized protein LY89DRAFT_665835 [Mollisia scopiformis]KUJ21403.1 hypothetical protein LY89DRAFT_665835 [Mollisia scopiformis]